MSFGDRHTVSSYRKIFGDSACFPTSASRMGSAAPRPFPGPRATTAPRHGASSAGMYRRIGRSSAPFSLVPTGSFDLSQTSVINNEFKVIRTNEKEQLQVCEIKMSKCWKLNLLEFGKYYEFKAHILLI